MVVKRFALTEKRLLISKFTAYITDENEINLKCILIIARMEQCFWKPLKQSRSYTSAIEKHRPIMLYGVTTSDFAK